MSLQKEAEKFSRTVLAPLAGHNIDAQFDCIREELDELQAAIGGGDQVHIREELADVLISLGCLSVALGCGDGAWARAVTRKNGINAQRQWRKDPARPGRVTRDK